MCTILLAMATGLALFPFSTPAEPLGFSGNLTLNPAGFFWVKFCAISVTGW